MRLRRSSQILINNAAKYTLPGGAIEIDLMREADDAVVRVRDNGVGIAPNAFHGFSRFSGSLATIRGLSEGGLGIGLSVVSKLVALHHGSVKASSEGLGKGSEFVVRLPLLEGVRAGRGDGPRVAAPLRQQGDDTHPSRIMVVDDEPDVGDSLGLFAGKLWADVRILRDGLSCIATIRDFQPDIVLVDIGMPGIDGYETARAFAKNPPEHKFVLVALTGWGAGEDVRRSSKPASICI